MELRLKRVYDDPSPDDGFRILVDRLWPRGLSKERAAIDSWAKDASPSAALRAAWHAAPEDEWYAYAAAYREELRTGTALADLRDELAEHPVVTLVFAASNPAHTHATVLLELLG